MNKPTPNRTYESLNSLDSMLKSKNVRLNSSITIFGSAAIGIYQANYLMKGKRDEPYSLSKIVEYLSNNQEHKKENEDLLRESKDLDLIVESEQDLRNIANAFKTPINIVILDKMEIYETTLNINNIPVEVFYGFELKKGPSLGKVNDLSADLIDYNEIFMQKLILKNKFSKINIDLHRLENTNYDLELLKKII